ncbi:MAG: hypothetical protein US51_C0017G0004 [Microgenomates group bacterium GW2011_GWA2_37_6]|nr:MAG: hypothetical protein US51_C0017G0004 [Microgenomates group bacterium GW2011_GWA2_37_6]
MFGYFSAVAAVFLKKKFVFCIQLISLCNIINVLANAAF